MNVLIKILAYFVLGLLLFSSSKNDDIDGIANPIQVTGDMNTGVLINLSNLFNCYFNEKFQANFSFRKSIMVVSM